MARKTLREPKIDTELAYAYAKTDRLHDMEDFLGMTNVADILEVGEKCFEDELYQAAKLLFTSISNWARLATTLIYLGENQGAVESARKAGKRVHERPPSPRRLPSDRALAAQAGLRNTPARPGGTVYRVRARE